MNKDKKKTVKVKRKVKLRRFMGYYYYENAPKSDFTTEKPLVNLYGALLSKI